MNDIIGNILQDLLLKPGAPTRLFVAEQLNTSDKTLYNVIRGKSQLTIEQVIKASEILNCDIIQEYYLRTGIKVNEPSESYKPVKNLITINLSLTGSMSSYEKFGDLLVEIKKAASKKGFDIA